MLTALRLAPQRGSPRFWNIFPWVVSGFLILVANFFTLIYALRYFAFSDPLMFAWLETVGISLALGFGIFDVVVILVRNNLNCTKVILQTRKYQVLEKFVVGPIVAVLKIWQKVVLDFCCGDCC